MQILFKQGWIDPTCIAEYTWKGSKKDNAYNLHELMLLQEDFQNEKTLLQLHGEKFGVMVDRTPKCHPEIAGEGIEYGWGLAKLKYRQSSITLKRGKELFRNLVRFCLDDEVLSITRIRSHSKKAREYILLYKALKDIDIDIDKIEGGVTLNWKRQ